MPAMCNQTDMDDRASSEDVWEDGDGSPAGPGRLTDLDREWEARRHQFRQVCARHDAQAAPQGLHPRPCFPPVQTGYREGLDEGKANTIQQGFNVGAL